MSEEKRKTAHQRVGKRRASLEEVTAVKRGKTLEKAVYTHVPGTKRKATTEKEGGEKKAKTKGKSLAPKLKINVSGLPPSLQSSTREYGQRAEKGSAPGNKAQKTLPGATQPKRAARRG